MHDPLYPLVWLLVWILGLLVQSIFINGIFISAKGSTGKYPDGTDDDSDMILYPVYKFLHKTIKRRYYFIKAMLDLSTLPRMDGVVIMWDDFWKDGLIVRGFRVVGNPDLYLLEKWIKDFYQGKMVYDKVNKRVAFYVERDVYKYPKWIVKPTFGCIICMASFWSIFIFLWPISYFYGWSFHLILLWFADIISVAYVNFIIFKSRV